MEKKERIAWVGKRALEIFREKAIVLSNRLEQKGLDYSVVIEIARCVDEAIEECVEQYRRENEGKDGDGLFTAFTWAALENDVFDRWFFKERPTVKRAEGEKENDRARDAILSGESDPSSPAPIQDSSHSAVSHAATRARIAEGIAGL